MRIYIAGPMAGLPQDNFPAFEAAETYLAALKHTPISPHRIPPAEHDGPCPRGPQGESAHTGPCHLKADIAQLVTCNAIALLDGWQASAGGRLELQVASQCGLQVYRLLEEGAVPPRNRLVRI